LEGLLVVELFAHMLEDGGNNNDEVEDHFGFGASFFLHMILFYELSLESNNEYLAFLLPLT
jgi:hypothetical protein